MFFHLLNPLSANPTKCSNILKQFVGKLPTSCLSVFDSFIGLALKGLKLSKISITELFCKKKVTAGFKLAIRESQFAHGFCLFADQFKQSFCVKFESPNFPSVGNFIFRKTAKLLFTLQARQFTYIVLQIVLHCTLFSSMWMAFWFQTPNGGAYSVPPYTLELLEQLTQF